MVFTSTESLRSFQVIEAAQELHSKDQIKPLFFSSQLSSHIKLDLFTREDREIREDLRRTMQTCVK